MNDILFYFKGNKNLDAFNELLKKYPHAKIKKHNGSAFDIIKHAVATTTTKFTWVVDLDTEGWESLLDYNVEKWDTNYLHIFENKNAKLYLAPRTLKIDNETSDFPEKKVIITLDLKFIPYDIFFLTYDENNAAKNLRFLLEKSKNIQVIKNVKGIFNAHLEAAKKSKTDFFWVVDADATIIDAFDFDYIVPEWDFDVVHIWKTINPINFLEYGHGGVKLIPKHLILNADVETAVDITTSIGAKIKIMNEVSNINNFATSPLAAWRSAFRECAKLASGIIARQNQQETNQRLDIWCNKGGNRPLGEYVKGGASAGCWFGETYKGNKEMLLKINDYDWLAAEFEQHIKMFPPETFKDYDDTNSEVNGNTDAITEAQALAIS